MRQVPWQRLLDQVLPRHLSQAPSCPFQLLKASGRLGAVHTRPCTSLAKNGPQLWLCQGHETNSSRERSKGFTTFRRRIETGATTQPPFLPPAPCVHEQRPVGAQQDCLLIWRVLTCTGEGCARTELAQGPGDTPRAHCRKASRHYWRKHAGPSGSLRSATVFTGAFPTFDEAQSCASELFQPT